RKHKTRCELPEDLNVNELLRCHRCKVLNLPCSFEGTNIIHVSSGSRGNAAVIVDSTPGTSDDHSPPSPRLSVLPDDPNHLCNDPEVFNGIESPYDVPREYSQPVKSARDLIVEDLLPCPLVPWGPMSVPGGFDWTEAPILAVTDLSNSWSIKKPRYRRPQGQAQDQYLSNILSTPQIKRLIEIFDTRYAPWLCGHRLPSTELLDLVSCTIASRHLDPLTQQSLGPRLLGLTERTFLNKLPSVVPSMESIQALLMLSLWSPLLNGDEQPSHPNLMLTAVNMAKSLRLSESSIADSIPHELATANTETRLWVLLSTVESMLCFGTGRYPDSERSAADYKSLELLRLSLSGQLMDLAQIGSKICLSGPHDVPHFYEQVQEILSRNGLPIYTFGSSTTYDFVSQHDTFYFHMLMVQYHGCRLLTTHRALRELRIVLEGNKNQTWIRAKYHGTAIVSGWGRDSIKTAQALLMTVLANSNDKLLSSCPDCILSMIAFAATWLIISNFSMHQLKCPPLGSACDRMITATIELLARLALGPEHVLAKYSHVIATLMEVWNRRKTEHPEPSRAGPLSDTETPGTTAVDETEKAPSVSTPGSSPFQSAAEWGTSNTDIFMDPSFWASFMDNLSHTSTDWDTMPVPSGI
ncbi:hypothetical protein BDZ89DRAFT_1062234, partial [Hymenopellis radicata]